MNLPKLMNSIPNDKKLEFYKAYGMFCSSSISLIINSSHAHGKQVFEYIHNYIGYMKVYIFPHKSTLFN